MNLCKTYIIRDLPEDMSLEDYAITKFKADFSNLRQILETFGIMFLDIDGVYSTQELQSMGEYPKIVEVEYRFGQDMPKTIQYCWNNFIVSLSSREV